MKKAVRKKSAKTAKRSRRIVLAAVAGAVALGNVSYTHAADLEDVFDERYYADEYSDLKQAFGYARLVLLDHFMKVGLYEGRKMNGLIDIIKYREENPDLEKAFGDDWGAYLRHYLTYGAYENRDNGADFDPVDYLNRYSDLKAAFGNDLLAAYRHYEEHGKQEGREGRSETVVRAEREAAARAQEEAALRAKEEAAAMAQEDAADRDETPEYSDPAEPEKQGFEIRSVEVTGSGRIRVTLNQSTEQALGLEAFSILCNSGGSDMTILSVSTSDNRVYDLSTTYYRDQEYDIQITLADGTAI